jgi:SPRY domain/F-box domain
MASLFDLSDDILSEIVSFLPIESILRLSLACMDFRELICVDEWIYKSLFLREFEISSSVLVENPNRHLTLAQLFSRRVPIPTGLRKDTMSLPNIHVDGLNVSFHGVPGRKDRTLIANTFFPKLHNQKSMLRTNLLPFVCPRRISTPSFPPSSSLHEFSGLENERASDHVLELSPSMISYFEVRVGSPGKKASVSENYDGPLQAEEWFNELPPLQSCIAIGLVNQKFTFDSRMPGWDENSYGYHSDDGFKFHNSSDGIPFGSKFSTNDVVGCGLCYYGTKVQFPFEPSESLAYPYTPKSDQPSSAFIFFTLNGNYLGPAFSISDRELTEEQWYPAVGLDSSLPIEFNFGLTAPFMFDLRKFELDFFEQLNPVDYAKLPKARLEKFLNRYFDEELCVIQRLKRNDKEGDITLAPPPPLLRKDKQLSPLSKSRSLPSMCNVSSRDPWNIMFRRASLARQYRFALKWERCIERSILYKSSTSREGSLFLENVSSEIDFSDEKLEEDAESMGDLSSLGRNDETDSFDVMHPDYESIISAQDFNDEDNGWFGDEGAGDGDDSQDQLARYLYAYNKSNAVMTN